MLRILLLTSIVFCLPGLARGQDASPLLVLGDSLSAAHNIPVDAGWVKLLESRLALREPPVPVINASISGETSAGGRARLPELLARHAPALVVLELGANDGLRGLPIDIVRENVAAMINMAREAGAEVLLIGVEIPINYGRTYRDRLRGVYQDLAEQTGVPLLPFLLEGVALTPGLMQDDGLHPTEEAQPLVLDQVWRLLAPMLGDPPPDTDPLGS